VVKHDQLLYQGPKISDGLLKDGYISR
jgi:hypothetical protein